jgi:hypothetical protein
MGNGSPFLTLHLSNSPQAHCIDIFFGIRWHLAQVAWITQRKMDNAFFETNQFS